MPALFRDRQDAAMQLALALKAYKGRHPLVIAIPRGAVGMARIIAHALDGEFDLVLVHKLGAPGNPELAVGAIDELGWRHTSAHAGFHGATSEWLDAQAAEQLEVLRQRRARYAPARKPLDALDRVVIVVDDGIATGATMRAALHSLRERKPAQLVCAVPVASPEALARLRDFADEVVCLHTPADFDAVGRYYRHFPQVEDAEVMALLGDTSRRR
jgi:putative phosphoribosyl transferase